MVDLLQACQIAKEYFLENTDKKLISKIYETESLWIVFGKSDGIEYGGSGISIDKQTKDVQLFTLPSLENFAILENAVQHEIPQ